jgi:hypothetical protein
MEIRPALRRLACGPANDTHLTEAGDEGGSNLIATLSSIVAAHRFNGTRTAIEQNERHLLLWKQLFRCVRTPGVRIALTTY